MAALQWAHDIACGMAHLRSHNLAHLDLKSGNVLLTSRTLTANAKICDCTAAHPFAPVPVCFAATDVFGPQLAVCAEQNVRKTR